MNKSIYDAKKHGLWTKARNMEAGRRALCLSMCRQKVQTRPCRCQGLISISTGRQDPHLRPRGVQRLAVDRTLVEMPQKNAHTDWSFACSRDAKDPHICRGPERQKYPSPIGPLTSPASFFSASADTMIAPAGLLALTKLAFTPP